MKLQSIVAGFLLWAVLSLQVAPDPVSAQNSVTTDPPPQPSAAPQPDEPCPKGKRGGAIGGIVVGSVFWMLLPMSIPVLITQTKKLKAHNKAKHERRCQYAPGS